MRIFIFLCYSKYSSCKCLHDLGKIFLSCQWRRSNCHTIYSRISLENCSDLVSRVVATSFLTITPSPTQISLEFCRNNLPPLLGNAVKRLVTRAAAVHWRVVRNAHNTTLSLRRLMAWDEASCACKPVTSPRRSCRGPASSTLLPFSDLGSPWFSCKFFSSSPSLHFFWHPPLRCALGMPNITLKMMDRDSFAFPEVDSRPLPALSGAGRGWKQGYLTTCFTILGK